MIPIQHVTIPADLAHQEIAPHVYVKHVAHLGDDLLALHAARLSTGNPTGVSEAKDDATRSRLMRDGHMSPFEMGALITEVQCMLLSRSQIFRHRTFAVNEFSGRYAEMPALVHVPTPDELRLQSTINHQMSEGKLSAEAGALAHAILADHCKEAHEKYEALLALGLGREQARFVIPQNQITRFWMQGTPRAWMQYLALRLPADVQPETQAIAQAQARLFAHIWPKTWALFEEEVLHAVKFSRTEAAALLDLLTVALADRAFAAKAAARRAGLDEKAAGRFAAKLGVAHA